ncbi:hypothetical protein CL619_02610 [archaeon]|nr:hypothetical protein [archaeon]|tara:strand:- start:2896 stop:3891 length:996 start_codon:yes stop_codon:yes gene_type:complete
MNRYSLVNSIETILTIEPMTNSALEGLALIFCDRDQGDMTFADCYEQLAAEFCQSADEKPWTKEMDQSIDDLLDAIDQRQDISQASTKKIFYIKRIDPKLVANAISALELLGYNCSHLDQPSASWRNRNRTSTFIDFRDERISLPSALEEGLIIRKKDKPDNFYGFVSQRVTHSLAFYTSAFASIIGTVNHFSDPTKLLTPLFGAAMGAAMATAVLYSRFGYNSSIEGSYLTLKEDITRRREFIKEHDLNGYEFQIPDQLIAWNNYTPNEALRRTKKTKNITISERILTAAVIVSICLGVATTGYAAYKGYPYFNSQLQKTEPSSFSTNSE